MDVMIKKLGRMSSFFCDLIMIKTLRKTGSEHPRYIEFIYCKHFLCACAILTTLGEISGHYCML